MAESLPAPLGSALRLLKLLRSKDSEDSDEEEEEYGPSIYQVTEQYIKPVTAHAGKMSWALMMNPEGLDCDLPLCQLHFDVSTSPNSLLFKEEEA